ncbi:MAG: single-stranded DNA-binding protein [Candidatus Aenigmatarchaeota archaeon]
MAYINHVFISGNVGKVESGMTQSTGVKAASFLLAVDSGGASGANTLWIRVNVYGKIAELVMQHLAKGDYVVVAGKLMQRRTAKGDVVTEVKGYRVDIIKKESRVIPK